MYIHRKIQESGLTDILPLMRPSATWGQYPVFSHPEFPQDTPWGVAAVWWLVDGRFSFLLEFRRAYKLTILEVAVNHWWLWQPLFTDAAGNISLLKTNGLWGYKKENERQEMRRRNERSQKARKEWENVDKERVKDSWWKDQSRRCDEEARLERKGIRMRHISLCPWISTWSGGGGGGLVVMSNFLWPMDCSPPDSSVHGIFQARTLESVAIPFPRESFSSRNQTCISCIAGGFFTAEPPRKPQPGEREGKKQEWFLTEVWKATASQQQHHRGSKEDPEERVGDAESIALRHQLVRKTQYCFLGVWWFCCWKGGPRTRRMEITDELV